MALTGEHTGIVLGLESFATLADGSQIANPRIFRVAERHLRRTQRRVSRRKQGSHRRRKAVRVLATRHQHVRCLRSDFHHKTARALLRQYDTLYVEAIQPANLSRRPARVQGENGGYAHNGASRKAGLNKSIQDAGWATSCLCSPARQHAPASEWKWSIQRTRPRIAVAVASAYTRASVCARMSARTVD